LTPVQQLYRKGDYQGAYKLAFAQVTRAKEEGRDDPGALVDLGEVLLCLDRFDEAVERLEEAQELQEQQGPQHTNMVRILLWLATGRYLADPTAEVTDLFERARDIVAEMRGDRDVLMAEVIGGQ